MLMVMDCMYGLVKHDDDETIMMVVDGYVLTCFITNVSLNHGSSASL